MLAKKGIPSNLIGSQIQDPGQSTQGQNLSLPQTLGAGLAQQPGDAQHIQVTEEQLQQIQQLVTNPAFENLRQQAQQNPQILPQLLQMLQQNHPSLYQLFTQNPQLLIALLMGNFPDIEEEFEGEEENMEDEGDDIEGEVEPQAGELSEEDYQAIQNVR